MKFFSVQETTPESFWRVLSDAGLVQGDMPTDSTKALRSDVPWFVKAMLSVAVWISSLFFLGFVVALLKSAFEDAWVRAIFGVIACALAGFYFRSPSSSVFFEQILFILALLGQALVLSVILNKAGRFDGAGFWLLAALFEAVILVAIPYQPNRFLSALATLIFLYSAVFLWGFASLFAPLCLASLAVALHFQWRDSRLWPVVAVALALVPFFVAQTQAWMFLVHGGVLERLPFWLWQISLIAVWLGVAYELLKRVTSEPLSPKNIGVWLLAFCLAVGTWPVPLALFALTVFFLGFSQRDKLLESIGIVQLLWSVGYYYYALQDTLLFKSLMLSVLGAMLLLLYAVGRYLLPETGCNGGVKT